MKRTRLILFVLLLCWPAALAAQVEIHFYSKDLGNSFPHAFVRLTGTALDTNYGFTAMRVSPAILAGPVKGQIQTVDARYVARSDRHFSLTLNEEQYRSVLGVVEKWRSAPQPSYRLNSSNCVHFVAEVAQALGLHAPADRKLMKKPKSFLEKVTRNNQALIAGWNRLPGSPSQRNAVAPRQN
jgi:hypothetical protein